MACLQHSLGVVRGPKKTSACEVLLIGFFSFPKSIVLWPALQVPEAGFLLFVHE